MGGGGFQVCLGKPGIPGGLRLRPASAGSILGSGSTPLQLEEGKGVFQYVLWVWGAGERQPTAAQGTGCEG